MQKSLYLFAALLLCSFYSGAQLPYLQVPAQRIPFNIKYGSHLQTVIKNTGKESAVFLPLFMARPGMEYALQSDSALFAAIKKQLTGNKEERKMQAINIIAGLKKSDLYLNKLHIADCNEVSAAFMDKLNSPVGNLTAVYHQQCDNFTNSAATLLAGAGVVPADSIAIVSLQGHNVFEVPYHGRPVKVDMDAGEPSFMETNAASPNKWASFDDIFADRTLIKDRYLFAGPNGKFDLCPRVEISNYRRYYLAYYTKHPFSPGHPYNVTGVWTLPPGFSVTWDYDVTYVMDTSQGPGQRIFNQCENWYFNYKETKSPVYLDSIANTIAAEYGAKFTDGREALQVTPAYYNGKGECCNLPFVHEAPYLKIEGKTGKDTVTLSLPFIALDVNTSKPVMIGDTLITATAKFNLWSVLAAPHVGPKELQYLQNVKVPPQTQITILAAYNPMVYNFTTGFKIDQLGKADALSFTQITAKTRTE